MNLVKPLVYYSGVAKRCTQAEFVEQYPEPVLLLEPFNEAEDEAQFETVQEARVTRGLPHVAPVAKRPGANPMGSMITLGRASNNDVELNAQSVSKFHGYFAREADGSLVFTDGDSSGGTFVDGTRLNPRVRTPLPYGVRLRFGSVEATLCDPAMLYELALKRRD